MTDPREFLDKDLRNDLKYLLCAATEWYVQESIPEDQKPTKRGGYFVQVYAMDSATMHARALLEFLTSATNRNHIGVNLFGIVPITSRFYVREDWMDPMNRYLMHVNHRPGEQYVSRVDGSGRRKHLKEMPVDFAREVVQLWGVFIERLYESQQDGLADLAQDVLKSATDESARVVDSDINQR